MITSAPFDKWWHNAYGLDTKVVSPPHVPLATVQVKRRGVVETGVFDARVR